MYNLSPYNFDSLKGISYEQPNGRCAKQPTSCNGSTARRSRNETSCSRPNGIDDVRLLSFGARESQSKRKIRTKANTYQCKNPPETRFHYLYSSRKNGDNYRIIRHSRMTAIDRFVAAETSCVRMSWIFLVNSCSTTITLFRFFKFNFLFAFLISNHSHLKT